MKKIKSYSQLMDMRDDLKQKISSYLNPDSIESRLIIRVGMGTSGLASGAGEVFDFLRDALKKRNFEAEVYQAGDMGYSYAEPTIQVIKPGSEPLVFGDVNIEKADEIIEKYIRNDEPVDGIIPVDYKIVDEI